jgi:glutamyl-tRNA synthetase
LGNYRTALFSYLFARKHGGKFLLRIEDTDKARSTKENEANILESLAWIGIEYDNADDLPRQSERSAIYKKYLERMIADGKAYVSKEAPKEAPKEGDAPMRTEVIRFKNPNKRVTFHDAIRGDITFDTTDLKDFVIAKSIDEPIFHLTVVVDDFEMGVTHVVRGEDHISNTPRHILIQEAIGAPQPIYAHLPLILSPDKTKLSKRKGAQPLTYYRDRGYLPEAILNYLALLGWNPGTDKELWTVDELVKTFDFSGIQKSGAMFNQEKLDWFNREYIKKMPTDLIKEKIIAASPSIKDRADAEIFVEKLVPLVIDRIITLEDIAGLFTVDGEFSFAINTPEYPKEKLLFKPTSVAEKTKEYLAQAVEILNTIPEESLVNDWSADSIKAALWDYATSVGRGEVLWPMRYALSGKDKSPDPFTIANLLGREETVTRINKAISML